MSVTEIDKYLLVEWGNGSYGLVPSEYLVKRPQLELTSGCTITISNHGEQQLATYLAMADDPDLLRDIIGGDLGPSVPPEPEVGDYTPSSASSWEPSDNETTDSEVEIKKPRLNVTRKRNPREKRSKKVIKPSNKVKPLVPDSLKKAQQMTMKTYTMCLKRQHESAIKAHGNKNTTQTKGKAAPSTHITVTIDMNLVFGMVDAMNKLVTGLGMIKAAVDHQQNKGSSQQNMGSSEQNTGSSQQNKGDENETLKAKVVDTIGEESCHSDESNRSEDNVLISNKYVNIEHHKQESIADEQPEPTASRTTKDSETQSKNTNELSLTENKKDKESTVKNDEMNNSKKNVTTNITKKERILSETQKQDTVSNTPPQKIANNMQPKKGSNDMNDENEWVPIGSGKTLIHREKFRKVKWTSYTIATRTLLLALFPRRTLATHSLTGKRSPAFQHKPAKMCLDPKKITDLIIEVMDRFDVKENLVRGIITTKCADESKMFRTRMEKKKNAVPKKQKPKNQRDCDKENS